MVNRKFYYSKLTPMLRSVMDTIIKKLQKFESIISIVNPAVTSKQIGMLFEIIDKDFPEIFYIDIKKTLIKIVEYGPVKQISINYLYSKYEVERIFDEIRDISSQILSPLSESDTILKREKHLHDYLASKVQYEFNSRDSMDYSIIGPLLHGHAICEGYAKAYKYLCEQSQLNCLVVVGKAVNCKTGKMEKHAWNILYIGNDSYAHVDVTWDSGKSLGTNLMYSYFNLSDKLIGNDHYWDRASVPVCTGSHDGSISVIESAAELADYLSMKIYKKEYSIDFMVNRKFNTTEELIELISKILRKRNLTIVKSFKAFYNCNTQYVHCDFDIM